MSRFIKKRRKRSVAKEFLRLLISIEPRSTTDTPETLATKRGEVGEVLARNISRWEQNGFTMDESTDELDGLLDRIGWYG